MVFHLREWPGSCRETASHGSETAARPSAARPEHARRAGSMHRPDAVLALDFLDHRVAVRRPRRQRSEHDHVEVPLEHFAFHTLQHYALATQGSSPGWPYAVAQHRARWRNSADTAGSHYGAGSGLTDSAGCLLRVTKTCRLRRNHPRRYRRSAQKVSWRDRPEHSPPGPMRPPQPVLSSGRSGDSIHQRCPAFCVFDGLIIHVHSATSLLTHHQCGKSAGQTVEVVRSTRRRCRHCPNGHTGPR